MNLKYVQLPIGSNMHHLRKGGRRDVRDTLTFEWIIFDFGKAFGKMGTQPFSLSAFAGGLFGVRLKRALELARRRCALRNVQDFFDLQPLFVRQ